MADRLTPQSTVAEEPSLPLPDSSGGDASSSPITVFQTGDEKLTEMALQALAPQRAGWNGASAAAMSEAVIMMVDDELLNIEMTEAFLAEAGYRNFVYTDDSRRALELMRVHRPGVLLLDLSMPHVSGLTILLEMRDDPQLRHLPVIVLTATTDPRAKLEVLSAGAMDFLSKPVDPSELALRIRNTLAATAYRNFLAQHDPMTGLANKARFRQEMSAVLETARLSGHDGALVHIGVDRLGQVNDALGRTVGDQLMQRLAKRLAHCVETEFSGDLSAGSHSPALFRLDGDEFAVIVPQTEAKDVFATFITRLMEAATFPFARGGQELFIKCSMGIAGFPQDAKQTDELMTKAGMALRHAKEAGRNSYEFFSEQLNEKAVGRLELGADLGKAFGRGEITLTYQPVVELATGRLVSACAVPSWKHRSGRVVEGAELMNMAAASDMGLALLEWTLEQAADHSAKWAAAGLQMMPIGVGVSLAHVRARDVGSIAKTVLRTGLMRGLLGLNLLQVPALDQLGRRELEGFSRLHEGGLRLALSQFGSGASSLQALRLLPWDEVEIDAALVTSLEAQGAPQLLRGVLAMLKEVGVATTAAGIASDLQATLLRSYGARNGRGPLIGPALSGIDFAVKWLPRTGKPPAKR